MTCRLSAAIAGVGDADHVASTSPTVTKVPFAVPLIGRAGDVEGVAPALDVLDANGKG
jgi:hypothetical protein